jgi:hypothetical protein
VGAEKTRMLKDVDNKDCAREVSDGNMRFLLGIGLEAIHVLFWQRTCLHFVCV